MITRLAHWFTGQRARTTPLNVPGAGKLEAHEAWLRGLLEELRQPFVEEGFRRNDYDQMLAIASSGELDVFVERDPNPRVSEANP